MNSTAIAKFGVGVFAAVLGVAVVTAVLGVVLAGTVALVVATLGALAFPLLYLRSPWEKSAVGRDAMLLSVCMAAILVYNVIRVLFFGTGVPPDFEVPRLLIYASLAVVLPRRAVLLWNVQRCPVGYAVESVTSPAVPVDDLES